MAISLLNYKQECIKKAKNFALKNIDNYKQMNKEELLNNILSLLEMSCYNFLMRKYKGK